MQISRIPTSYYWYAVGVAFLVIVLASIASCDRSPPPLPAGLQVMKGILVRAELTLNRRGSHALLIEEVPQYYVESPTVNLHTYEGREVELQGMFEHNVDPHDLPVLVVSKVLSGGLEELRSWTIPGLGLSLGVPSSWRGSVTGDSAQFTNSGSVSPILRVRLQTSDVLPFDFKTLAVFGSSSESGSPLHLTPTVIHGKKAVRMEREGISSVTVFVDIGADALIPSSRKLLTVEFLSVPEDMVENIDRVLATLRLSVSSVRTSAMGSTGVGVSAPTGSVSSNGSPTSAKPSQEGKPCGGPAGILCGSGYYCQITDSEADIGMCKRI